MSEQQRQHLSALVDGEVDDVLLHATVSALEANPELAEAWESFHLIGSAMRGERVRPDFRRIAAGVSARVEREEPVAPATAFTRRGRNSRFGAFIGAALAAAAAFLAVFAVPQLFDPESSGQAPTIAVDASPPDRQFQLASPGQRWNLDQPSLERKLDRFLVNHQERSPASGIKGFFPYATVVGYETGR